MCRLLLSQIAKCLLFIMVPIAVAWAEPPEFVQGEILLEGALDQHQSYQIRRYYPLSNVSAIKVPLGQEQRAVAHHRGKGKKASLNLVAHKFFSSQDPISSYQWHFDSIQLQQAHGISKGDGVVVAVLDTGFNPGGDDSVVCSVVGADIINNDSNPHDGNGHGTHVSGTVAQATDNNVGVAGVAPNSCLMAVKVLNDSGSGSFADIADGIRWATDNGAKVINMSLGIAANYQVTNDFVMDSALEYAYSNGVTVVAASGNDGFRKNVSYPAIYPTVISVGATDLRNQKTRYSNSGEGLDVMAPGGNMAADQNGDGYADGVLQETFDADGVFSYWFYQGTFMASPHVAGVAALLVASGTATSPDDIRAALQSTALDLGESGYDSKNGYGLVQAYSALQWQPGLPPTDPPVACTDADGDGVCLEDGDCDDGNADVYPGFNEKGRRRNDGLDNDCDGVIDPNF